MNRRRFLATTGLAALPFVAGCVGGGDGDTGADGGSRTENTRDETQTTAGEETGTIPTEESTTAAVGRATPPPSGGTSQARPFRGTDIVTERDQADVSIENTTNKPQTITLTVTPLPNDIIPRPISKAPYEPRELSERSPLFSETVTLSPGGDKVYLGRVRPVGSYQVAVDVRNGPTVAFDWHRETEVLRIDTKTSSVEFSSVPSFSTTTVVAG